MLWTILYCDGDLCLIRSCGYLFSVLLINDVTGWSCELSSPCVIDNPRVLVWEDFAPFVVVEFKNDLTLFFMGGYSTCLNNATPLLVIV